MNRRHGLWGDAFRRLFQSRIAVAAACFLLMEVVIVLLSPWITLHRFDSQDLMLSLATPSFDHWMGTDTLGRDLFSRLVYGGRISLIVALSASLVSVVVGVFYGATSGFMGGRIDNLMMRVVDVLYAVPFVFFVIILMVYFGRNIFLLFIALGLTQWLTMSRIVRGQVISLKRKDFVEAATSMGIPKTSIILHHLIPNSLGSVVVYLTLTIPYVMLEEAFLSFLGLGVQAPMASLGTLISDGMAVVEIAPWNLLFPVILLSMTLLSLNFLGDGLRDALDPKGAKD